MNDFLLSLVARAGNRAPVLERRQRALFEPAVPRSDTENQAIQAEARETPRVPREQPIPERPATIRAGTRLHVAPAAAIEAAPAPVVPMAPPAPLPAPRRHARAEPETVHVPSHSHPETTATPSVLRAPHAAVAGIEAKAAVTRAVPAPVETGNAGRDARAWDVAPPQPLLSPLRASDASAASARQGSLRPAELRVRRDDAMHALQPAPRQGARRETAPAVLIAKAQASAKPEAAAAAAMPAPVHITIGRVEVRAHTTTETRPRVPPPAAPRLKLEDYLRERNGGAR